MRQPRPPVLPISPPAHDPPPGDHARPSLTERVAGWSARHRKTAVSGWLLLVAAIFLAGHALGAKNLPQYDPGQSGQAERVLHQVAPAQYDRYAETVLIQATAPGATFATDPAMRQAVSQAAASLAALPDYATGITTPLSAGGQALVSRDGRSALVTFDVPGNVHDVNQAASALQHAVATRCRTRAACPDWPASYCGRFFAPSAWPAMKIAATSSSQPKTAVLRCPALQPATRSVRLGRA